MSRTALPWKRPGGRQYLHAAVLLVSAGSAVAAFAQAPRNRTGEPLPLIPQVRSISWKARLPLTAGLRIDATPSDADASMAADDLRAWCGTLGIPGKAASQVHVRLLRVESVAASVSAKKLADAGLSWQKPMHDEGYAILHERDGLTLVAETGAGLFYAAQTVKQLLHADASGAFLATIDALDWPAMRYRGFSDDVTRGGLPTMDFFREQIRTFAAYKLNVYSLYMENTFRYDSMPAVAPHGGALTPEEAAELAAYARRYHVTLIPEQESFAHLHRILNGEQFASVVETPLGGVLAPGQTGSLPLIEGWFEELARAFPADMLHIGADETFDLGKGRTKDAVEKQGVASTYMDFLLRIHDRLAPLHRRLLFWGDIALDSPEQVARLPHDMIAVTWVYEPHPEGYARWLTPFRDSGIETWVAPGVSNWRRVYPDQQIALGNIAGLVAEGQAAGSTGVLNTAWNDDGEELPASNWYGVLFGAAASWQPGRSEPASFAAAYGPVFHGDSKGQAAAAQAELIAAASALRDDKQLERSLQLFWLDPWSPTGRAVAPRLTPSVSAMRLHAESAAAHAVSAQRESGLREADAMLALELGARKLDFIGLKFQNADRIDALYQQAWELHTDLKKSKEVGELLRKIGGPGGLCQDLRDGYNELGEMYAELWRREYRPYALANIQNRYTTSANLWQSRMDWFTQALLEYQRSSTLPALSAAPGHP